MHLSLDLQPKIEKFVGLFQLLKNWGSLLNLQFKPEELYIQLMDKSHVCLSNIVVKKDWFSEYTIGKNISQTSVCVDANYFCLIINQSLKYQKLEISADDVDPEKIFISILSKKDNYNHFYELNAMDFDQELLEIPETEYDVEFEIDSKKIIELVTELSVFGEDLHILCSEEKIELSTNGDNGKLKISLPPENLVEYAISEGETIEVVFSLNNILKKCLSNKLTDTVSISISKEIPMSVKYNLGDDSKVNFYVAPKMTD